MTIEQALQFMANTGFAATAKWQMLAFVLRQMCLALGIDTHLVDQNE